MSGFEVVAVIGVVASVISAYEAASKVVANFKDKRPATKAEQLELSLARSPLAVEDARDSGVERFGQAFANGDQIAREALKDVLIALQSSLLTQLASLAHRDDVVDFSTLVEISDLGRRKSVEALWELYTRMAAAAAINQHPSLLQGPPSHSNNIFKGKGQTQAIQAIRYGVKSDKRHAWQPPGLPHRQMDGKHESRLDRQITVETISTTTSSKSPSSWRRPFQLRPSRSSTTHDQNLSQPRLDGIPSRESCSPQSNTSPEFNGEAFGLEANPWEQVQSLSVVDSNDTSSVVKPTTPPTTLDWPSPMNDYGGFCQGAYYLQAGLHKDGVKLRNASIATTGESWYWGCRNSKCVFESPACKIRKEFFFDDSVCQFRGLKYRLAFLAKSHVALKRSKNKVYSYRCIFCVLQGKGSPIITSIRSLLEHVVQHRGQPIDESILAKTLCINGRLAADEDYFDINLPPLETISLEVEDSKEKSLSPEREEGQDEPPMVQEKSSPTCGLGISSAWSLDGDDALNEHPWGAP